MSNNFFDMESKRDMKRITEQFGAQFMHVEKSV